jgi:acetyl-CoA carboxylase biotin carboxyl carrier protein
MADSKGPAAIDPRLVRRLADILSDTNLTEIEVEQGGLRIRVARQVQMAAAAPVTYAVAPPAGPAPLAASAGASPAASGAAAPAEPAGEPVKSPMVGTVYLQPKPGDPPFVKVGDRVSAGQTLLIVEAMKTMNPIASPRAGVVAQILVADAQPVEFGEALILLE